MTRRLTLLVAFAGIALVGFFLGQWWENTRYLPPHRDELVIQHFLEPALDEIAKDSRHSEQTRAIYRRSRISTIRVAGISCLTFQPLRSESEWTREVCFTDDGQLIESEGY